MLHEALSKMASVFDPKILLRGQEYFQKGLVLNLRLSEGLLKARVKGNSSHIYDVHMDLKKWPSKPAHCSCPYQINCEHAAACLFSLRDREKSEPSTETAQNLDRKLDIWLKNLRVQEEKSRKNPDHTHHLIYLLEIKNTGYEHKIIIQLALAKILKRGGYGSIKVFHNLSDSKKQHFMDDDSDIVAQLLFKCDSYGWFDHFTLRNGDLLTRILKTKRAFFSSNTEDPVQLGEDHKASCEWSLSSNGLQRIVLSYDHERPEPILLDTSWYFNLDKPIMGKLITDYTIKQLNYLLQVPPIPLDQAKPLADKMEKNYPEFPKPKVYPKREFHEGQPKPVLLLDAFCDHEDIEHLYDKDEYIRIVFAAKLCFNYSGIYIEQEDPSVVVVHEQGDVLYESTRNFEEEDRAFQTLKEYVPLRKPQYTDYNVNKLKEDKYWVLNECEVLEDLTYLYEEVIPHLKKKGWEIQCVSPLYNQVLHEEEVEWYSDIKESGNDFFSYQLGILVEGKQVSIVPLVADMIRSYKGDNFDSLPDEESVHLPLREGVLLKVPAGRIKPLVRLLMQLGLRHINEDQQLKINKYQFILMQEAELALKATRARWQGAESIRTVLGTLINVKHIPIIEPPSGLKANLRDYQQEGLNWLQFLRNNGFNGILADDMGLGKTVQTLAHLQSEQEQGRLKKASLIIAPTSLMGNWLSEANRFTPNLNVLVYHGLTRHQDDFDDYDVVISTYGLIHRDKEKFISYPFYYLILDEAQFIKNARTKTTHVIQQLNASHRLCLTGTPLENHLGELWSLFHFLMPGLLGDAKQFRLWFRTPIEKYADMQKKEILSKRVMPFLLRRNKNQVAKELPPKTEMLRMIEITGPQRDLYEAIRMSMEKKVRDAIARQGLSKSHIVLLDALLKLRQVCCDPQLLSLPEAEIAYGNSAKLEALMELLDNLMEEGRRVLVFSQFTSMLQLIEEQVTRKKYPYLKLTGQTQNRHKLVEQFQEGNTPIFLISLKAGGTGLNLTKADTVIHYDPWWNPAVEDQATDRTHRIGQENPVFVYKLITQGTVEEAILKMQEKKRSLVEGLLSQDAAKTLSLKEEDLDDLFKSF